MRETDPTDDSAIGFTVGTVAQALDIPVATLRSWNQRYGVGPGPHRPGEHCHYTAGDVVVLRRMVDLVRAGVGPRSAAEAARTAPPEPVPAGRALAQLLPAGRYTPHLPGRDGSPLSTRRSH